MLCGEGLKRDKRTSSPPNHECNALQGAIFFGFGSISRQDLINFCCHGGRDIWMSGLGSRLVGMKKVKFRIKSHRRLPSQPRGTD